MDAYMSLMVTQYLRPSSPTVISLINEGFTDTFCERLGVVG